jgi:hypothetical protein
MITGWWWGGEGGRGRGWGKRGVGSKRGGYLSSSPRGGVHPGVFGAGGGHLTRLGLVLDGGWCACWRPWGAAACGGAGEHVEVLLGVCGVMWGV